MERLSIADYVEVMNFQKEKVVSMPMEILGMPDNKKLVYFDPFLYIDQFLGCYSTGDLTIQYLLRSKIIKSEVFEQRCPDRYFDEKKDECLLCLSEILLDQIIAGI